MSRQNIDECRYNRDQKSFASMLEKLIKAAKEGTSFFIFAVHFIKNHHIMGGYRA